MANTTIYPYGTTGQVPANISLVNDLSTGGIDKALSAEQGKVLNTALGELDQRVGDLSDLQTTNKASIVDAVNEAAQTGGSGGGGGADSRIANIEENIFAFIDESSNIGAYIDDDGFHAPNILEYELVNI